ncbi:MAG: hotdog fold domain-containing protein [Acidobacteriota bacterium]
MNDLTSANSLLDLWGRLRPIPGGTRVFSYLLAKRVPYSGSIRARIEELTPGYARARLRDRKRLRNHLASIHAIALTNLGELTSGLAMTAAMPRGLRGIPTELNIEFLKKARGPITAEGRSPTPDPDRDGKYEAEALMKDSAGDTVAILRAQWVVSHRP